MTDHRLYLNSTPRPREEIFRARHQYMQEPCKLARANQMEIRAHSGRCDRPSWGEAPQPPRALSRPGPAFHTSTGGFVGCRLPESRRPEQIAWTRTVEPHSNDKSSACVYLSQPEARGCGRSSSSEPKPGRRLPESPEALARSLLNIAIEPGVAWLASDATRRSDRSQRTDGPGRSRIE